MIGIYSLDLATGQESLITAYGMNPVVSDGIVVWQTTKSRSSDPLSADELSLHYLKMDGSQTDTIFYTTGEDNPYPTLSGLSISGNKIVWAFYPPESKAFYVYDLSTAKTQSVTPTLPVRNPIISGDKVALTFSPDGGSQARTIGIYSLTTGETVTIARSEQPLVVWGMDASKGTLYSEPLANGTSNLYFTSLNG
jgi:hypothetical protein